VIPCKWESISYRKSYYYYPVDSSCSLTYSLCSSTASSCACVSLWSRVQEGIDTAIADGKRVGRPPYGYTVEDGFLQRLPDQYVRAQNFIREVQKGREKRSTAVFFDIPESKVRSILTRSETNYEIPFDNGQWQIERAKVNAGEKDLPPLGNQSDGTVSEPNPQQ
jgi:hypothetical protein